MRDIKEKVRQQLASGDYFFGRKEKAPVNHERLRKEVQRAIENVVVFERLSLFSEFYL